MAHQYPLLVLPMQMHRAAEAVLIHLAISALTRFHPLAVTEGLETVFPNVKEIVLIDITLHEAAIDVGTSGNGAINQDGADGDASATKIEPVADLTLVRTDVGLTTEFRVNFSFLSGRDNEVHQLAQVHAIELQIRVIGGATDRLDAEKPPRFYVMFN